MAVGKVGASGTAFLATTGASAGMTGGYGQSPTAGNLLVMGVTMSTNVADATTCTTPAGWTASVSGGAPTGGATFKAAIYTFWKIATGGDTSPAVTVSGGAYSTGIVIEELSGLASASPVDAVSTVGTWNAALTNPANSSVSSGPVTTTNAADWVWSFAGIMAPNGAQTVTWSGGSAQSADGFLSAARLSTASQSVSSAATFTPSVTVVGSGACYNLSVASIAFKQAAGGGTNVTVAGSTATATAAASAGTVSTVRNVVVAGAVAAATALALTGVATGSAAQDATYAGSTATATAQALTGTATTVRNATVAGSTATGSAQALTGVASAVRNVTVAGSTATATALALPGTATTTWTVTINGGVATATAQALAGVVNTGGSISVPGNTATGTAQANPGTVQAVRVVTVPGSLATATATALPGTAGAGTTIPGSTATGTATARNGTVTVTRTITIPGTTATATAQANTGTVATTGSVTIAGSTATATATALTGAVDIAGPFPTVTRGELTFTLPDSALTLTLPTPALELTMANWHAGDTEPPLDGTCTDNGTPVDLTAAVTATAHVCRADATILTRAVTLDAQATSPGKWSLAWQTDDLPVAGTYVGEVQVGWPGGRVQTFGPASFSVARQLA